MDYTGSVSTTTLTISERGHQPPGRRRLGGRFLGLALKQLWRNRSRTLITLFSLVFAQVIMLLTFGFIRNFQQMLPDQVCRASSGHVQLTHPDYPSTQKPAAFLPEVVEMDEIRQVFPQVERSRPRVVLFGFLQKGDEQKLVVGRGVEPALEVEPILVAGENLPPEKPVLPPYPILVGKDAASVLGVEPGGLVIFHHITASGRLDNVQCRVRGVVDEGIPERNRRAVVIHIGAARKMMDLGEGCHEQQLILPDEDLAAPAAARLAAGLGPGVKVSEWREFNPMLRRTMSVSMAQTWMVAFIVVVVTLFGISSTISVTTPERVRELGLLAVLGYGPRRLFAYVLCEGLVIGVTTLGVSAVLVLALTAVLRVQGIDLTPIAGERIVLDGILIDMHMRPTPSASDFVLATSLILGVSLFAGFLPALRAARLRPARALRATV